MTNLSEYKNPLVFECTYNPPKVNTLHELIVDFDAGIDTKICRHCFYNSKAVPVFEHIESSKVNRKKNRSLSSKKGNKKNKSVRK